MMRGAALRAGLLLALLLQALPARAGWIWVEGEKPVRAAVTRHPYWYDQVKSDQLSGRDFLSHWDEAKPGEASYRISVPESGAYELWVRSNPVQSSLAYRIDDRAWTPIEFESQAVGSTNIATDGKVDLRFIAWVRAGSVELKKGRHSVAFRFESTNHHHGSLDCFVLTDEPFRPHGIAKPDQLAEAARKAAAANPGWFAFDPPADRYDAKAGFDLRSLNERQAGDGGFIAVKDSKFVHSRTGRPVRFWAVNGPPGKDLDALRREARMLAKHGVNLVRIHHGYFDAKGEVDAKAVQHALDIVKAMKAEGIYSYFSIYFPLWMTPTPDTPWLLGYDGKTHPFAALFFNHDFQEKYQAWWKALLLTPDPATGKRLVDEPAVAGLEMQNEDSYFFWTFNTQNIPEPQLRILETQFGAWLKKRYGSLDAALRAWNGQTTDRDRPADGRIGFRPLWNMAHEKTQRDQDTARFLAESQRSFYQETETYLRSLGFRGVITASNWITADPVVLGPLENYTYTVGDFIDRHGYFSCDSHGDSAEWSVRPGHSYIDRSALRFDAEQPGKPRLIAHPAMDTSYDNKPSMISETTWNRPNRYRSEAPLYLAAYGALQDTDAIVHFALDTTAWTVKPNYFMQPWTLMSPAMMGQFPAAALIYRKGLIKPGEMLVNLNLKMKDLYALKGTPLPQQAALDELRLREVPRGTTIRPGQLIDPLVHYAGRTNVNFTERGEASTIQDLSRYIDHGRRRVTSTTGELRLDYGKGILKINAPSAQGVSGALSEAGTVELDDVTISSKLEMGHLVAVSLDDKPLGTSGSILVQAMSEEKPLHFRAARRSDGAWVISDIGQDPWLVKDLEGQVRFKRGDASKLRVMALDENGMPRKAVGTADRFELESHTVYYRVGQ